MWPILTPDRQDRGSFRAGDFYVQTYACSTYKARQILAGHLPLWNPYIYSGHPYLADLQNSALYPLSFLTVLLSAPWGYSVLALEAEAIFHVFLAAAFTYLLGRRLFRNRGIALVVATVFAFGGYLSSYPPLQLPILETAAWTPLILFLLDLGATGSAAVRYSLAPRTGLLYCLLAGLVLGVAILAGHAQTAMYVFYLAAAWYAYRSRGHAARALRPTLGGLLAFGLAAFGFAAVQLLPALELMRLSIRASVSYQDLAGGLGRPDLLQLVLPGSAGFWSPLYVGLLPLGFVLFAWWAWLARGLSQPSRRWRRDVVFWTLAAIVSLLLGMGGEVFFYDLFYLAVPGFGLFRSQERVALVFSLSMALLSGYGLQQLAATWGKRPEGEIAARWLDRLFLGLGAGLGGLAVLLFFGATQGSRDQGQLMQSYLGVTVFLGMVLAGGWMWARFWRRRRWRAGPAWGMLLAVVVLDLFTLLPSANIQGRRPERQVQASPLIETLCAADAGQPFRVHHGGYYLPGNYGCLFGLEDTLGASQLQLAGYAQFLDEVPQERTWELLDVDYVVTWRSQLVVPSEIVYHTTTRNEEDVYLHELEAQAPRAWVVYQAKVVPHEQVLARVSRPDFDPYRLAILEDPLDPPLAGPAREAVPVELAFHSAEHLVADVDMPTRGLLVLSEQHYPGWRAWVDGARVPVRRANGILRAVDVPAGAHRIEMKYRPKSFYLGAGGSLLTCLLVLGYTTLVWRGSRGQS
jgi:hypothetical protein